MLSSTLRPIAGQPARRERGQHPGAHERRLAAPRRSDHRREPACREPAEQRSDRVVATEEQRGVFGRNATRPLNGNATEGRARDPGRPRAGVLRRRPAPDSLRSSSATTSTSISMPAAIVATPSASSAPSSMCSTSRRASSLSSTTASAGTTPPPLVGSERADQCQPVDSGVGRRELEEDREPGPGRELQIVEQQHERPLGRHPHERGDQGVDEPLRAQRRPLRSGADIGKRTVTAGTRSAITLRVGAEHAAQRVSRRRDHVPTQRADDAAVLPPSPQRPASTVVSSRSRTASATSGSCRCPPDRRRAPSAACPDTRPRPRAASRAARRPRSAKGAPPVTSSAGGLGTTDARADGDHGTSYGAARFGEALELERRRRRRNAMPASSSTRSRTASDARIWPGPPASHRRAASTTGVPNQSSSSEVASPVESPTRIASPSAGIALRQRGDRLLPRDRAGDRVGDASQERDHEPVALGLHLVTAELLDRPPQHAEDVVTELVGGRVADPRQQCSRADEIAENDRDRRPASHRSSLGTRRLRRPGVLRWHYLRDDDLGRR